MNSVSTLIGKVIRYLEETNAPEAHVISYEGVMHMHHFVVFFAILILSSLPWLAYLYTTGQLTRKKIYTYFSIAEGAILFVLTASAVLSIQNGHHVDIPHASEVPVPAQTGSISNSTTPLSVLDKIPKTSSSQDSFKGILPLKTYTAMQKNYSIPNFKLLLPLKENIDVDNIAVVAVRNKEVSTQAGCVFMQLQEIGTCTNPAPQLVDAVTSPIVIKHEPEFIPTVAATKTQSLGTTGIMAKSHHIQNLSTHTNARQGFKPFVEVPFEAPMSYYGQMSKMGLAPGKKK